MGGVSNCSPQTIMPFYEFRCQEHGRFEVRQQMSSDKVADCTKCGKPAEFRISKPSIRIAVPLILLQELPHGQGYKEIDRKADSSYSDERNLDIPPDYPNLLEV